MHPDSIRSRFLTDIPHGFLGRRGGVSTGMFEGLNVGLGSQDDPAAIAENRYRAVDAVAPGRLLATLHQVHSAQCVVMKAATAADRPQADAMVTDRPDLLLGILTADCAPVLLADRGAGVVGAAHAGWKGALGGVTDATIAAMEGLGAVRDRVVAAIGPCIGRASYEVGDAFRLKFEADRPDNERFFRQGRSIVHHQFDLEAYVADRVVGAGIMRVEAVGLDTYADEHRFFSYRRATHRGDPDYGRQISLIGAAFA